MDKSIHAAAIFNKLANQYQDKFMDTSLYHETFDLFCSLVAGDAPEILELACGPGNITRYLLSQRPDLKILGLDLAPNMVLLAKANNPGAEFRVMDCREIDKIIEKFDGIMCGFCLPYLSKEETSKLIHDTTLLLKPGGIIYISTMEDDYHKSGWRKGSSGDEIFMHYYTAKDLTDELCKYEFTVIEHKRIVYQHDGEQITDLVLIAIKQR